MDAFDPLGINRMGRAQQARQQWDMLHKQAGGMDPFDGSQEPLNPMGTAPHRAETDLLPQFLNEQAEDADMQGDKYKFGYSPSLRGLLQASKGRL